jgi:glycerophosphoryl diester phosphodiesterase
MKEKIASSYPFYDIPGPIAIVHRGGDAAGAKKENSMLAFESAYRAGLTYAETDVVTTRDGTPLAFHGSRNDKVAAKTGLPNRQAIQAMTLKEVRENIRVGGELLPTLEEVLTTFPDMRFFIDPKTAQSVRPTADLINRLGAQDRVSIGAFSFDRTRQTAELLGGQRDVCTSLAALGSTALMLLGSRLTTPFIKPYFNRTKATSLQVPSNIVSADMVTRAHELGIHVIVWPFRPEQDDNRAYMDRALQQGVHGLMSDHTHEMVDAVLTHDPTNQSIHHG